MCALDAGVRVPDGVLPLERPRERVERVHVRVGAPEVDHAIDDRRGRLDAREASAISRIRIVDVERPQRLPREGVERIHRAVPRPDVHHTLNHRRRCRHGRRSGAGREEPPDIQLRHGGGVDHPLLGVETVPREIEAVGGPVGQGGTRRRRRRAHRAEPFAGLEPCPATELQTVALGARAQHDVHRLRIRRQRGRERPPAHHLHLAAGDDHDPLDGPRLAREAVALVSAGSTDRPPPGGRQVVGAVEPIARRGADAEAAAEKRGIVCAPVAAPEGDLPVARDGGEASLGLCGAVFEHELLAGDLLVATGRRRARARRTGRPRPDCRREAYQQTNDSQGYAPHDDVLHRHDPTAP